MMMHHESHRADCPDYGPAAIYADADAFANAIADGAPPVCPHCRRLDAPAPAPTPDPANWTVITSLPAGPIADAVHRALDNAAVPEGAPAPAPAPNIADAFIAAAAAMAESSPNGEFGFGIGAGGNIIVNPAPAPPPSELDDMDAPATPDCGCPNCRAAAMDAITSAVTAAVALDIARGDGARDAVWHAVHAAVEAAILASAANPDGDCTADGIDGAVTAAILAACDFDADAAGLAARNAFD